MRKKQDYEKIMQRLNEIEGELNHLLNLRYDEGRERYNELYQLIDMIVRRTYPNYKEILHEIHGIGMLWSGSRSDEAEQKDYEKDIKKLVRGINMIKEEYGLFEFNDFTPTKEKIEREWRIGSDKILKHIRKKKIEK